MYYIAKVDIQRTQVHPLCLRSPMVIPLHLTKTPYQQEHIIIIIIIVIIKIISVA